MFIKAIHPQNNDAAHPVPQQHLVIETTQYIVEHHDWTDNSKMPDPLGAWAWHAPFPFPHNPTFNHEGVQVAQEGEFHPFHFVILRPLEPYQQPIVLCDCNVFIENENGKTVDTFMLEKRSGEYGTPAAG